MAMIILAENITALATSTNGLLIPYAMTFDYGHSAEGAQSKMGDPSMPCIFMVYSRDK